MESNLGTTKSRPASQSTPYLACRYLLVRKTRGFRSLAKTITVSAGWNLAGIERLLVPPPELTIGEDIPVYWLRSDGYVLKFYGIGVTAENDVDASVLSIDDGKLVITNKHGEKSLFTPDGWLEQRFDRYGNGTLFVYDDVDNDDEYHEIEQVIDQTTGHATTFGYASTSTGDPPPSRP